MPQQHPAPGSEIALQGAVNFRELGGYPAADGRTVRYGLLYRGGNLDALRTPADRAALQSWRLCAVLDLRSAGEAAQHPDPPLPGAQYRRVCAMRMADGSEMDFSAAGITRLAAEKAAYEKALGRPVHDYEWFAALYRQMPFGNPAYHTLFTLLEQRRAPLLFHCTCGKDRTGIAAMLILLALGVGRADALTDYMLTNRYRRAVIAASLRGKAAQERKLLLSVEGVSRPMAEGTLDEILRRFGSFEAYFAAEYGLDAARLQALRDFYLE